MNDIDMMLAERLQVIKQQDKFNDIVVELTNACNLQCSFCTNHSLSRDRGFMNDDMFKMIVDKVAVYKNKMSVFSFGMIGEPLLHPKFLDYVRIVQKANISESISLTTNGLLLTKDICEGIVGSGIERVYVSVNAFHDETYKNLTACNTFNEVCKNIENLIAIKKQRKSAMKVIVRFVENEDNYKELDLFVDKWKDLADWIGVYRLQNWAGALDTKSKEEDTNRLPCLFLWNTLSLYWNGDVALCCMDSDAKEKFGNINDMSVSEIYFSDKRNLIREAHLKRHFAYCSLCGNCDHEMTDVKSKGYRVYSEMESC